MAVSSPKPSGNLAVLGPGLLAFLFRRAVAAFVSLVVFAAAVFVLIDLLIPYDNAATSAGDSVSVGFVDYMAGLIRGDLGLSFSGAPVPGLIAEALPTTLSIFATGGILAYLLGSWLGRIVEWSRGALAVHSQGKSCVEQPDPPHEQTLMWDISAKGRPELAVTERRKSALE